MRNKNVVSEQIVPEQKKLNMGCGFNKLDDHWNVDVESKCNPNQVLDFEITPWPYKDNFFERITADNILEHLGQSPKIFTNIYIQLLLKPYNSYNKPCFETAYLG